jgi:hypothetical protein
MVADTVAKDQRTRQNSTPRTGASWSHPMRMIGVLVLILGSAGILAAPAAQASQGRRADTARQTAAAAAPRTRSAGSVGARLWRPADLRHSVWGPAAASEAATPGSAWRMQRTPNPPRRLNGILLADSCASPADCTAVGSYFNGAGITVTLAERWNGTSWRIWPTPNPASATWSEFFGVSCPAARACTATGYYQSRAGTLQTLAESWNGTSWAIQRTPNPAGSPAAGFMAVSCTSPSACTATGDYNSTTGVSQVLAERWNGTKWSIQATPDEAGAKANGLFGVSCTGPRSCTAAGAYVNLGGATQTLAEAWNGTSWAIQPTPIPTDATGSQLLAVSCTSPSACTAVGDYINSSGTSSVLAERWNGTRWAIQATPTPTGGIKANGPNSGSGGGSELYAVSCTAASACTAVGTYVSSAGSLATLAEAWNGTSWSVQATPNPSRNAGSQLSAVACTSEAACSTVGSYAQTGKTAGVPLAEAWNGASWSLQATPTRAGAAFASLFHAVSCPSAGTCVAVGQHSNRVGVGVTLAEAWNGTSWHVQYTPSPAGTIGSQFKGVSCVSPRACSAVGNYATQSGSNMALAEGWNGTRWRIQATPLPAGAATSSLGGVSCTSASNCVAVGSYNTSTGSPLPFADRWNGTSWSVQPMAAPVGTTYITLTGVSCTSASHCVAVGGYGARTGLLTLAEVWNGTSWHVQQTPNPVNGQGPQFSGVSCTSASACTAVGSYSGPRIEQTLAERWDGTNWSLQPTPNQPGAARNELDGVSCTSASTCTAVGLTALSDGVPPTALAMGWDGSGWHIQAVPVPAGSSTSALAGVSCTSSACTAAGSYFGRSGIQVTLAERKAG